MNVLIFGASGDTGQQLVQQALDQGHQVTAFVRDPSKMADRHHPNLKLVQGDITDAKTVEQVVHGQDAVLSALGSRTLKKNPKLVEGVRHIVQAMEQVGVRRLVYESALGVGDSRQRINPIFRFVIIPLVLRNAIADHEEKESILKQSLLDWVIVRPAGLTNGPRRGDYRHGESIHFGAKIARADVADFMLHQMTDNTYLHRTPGISE